MLVLCGGRLAAEFTVGTLRAVRAEPTDYRPALWWYAVVYFRGVARALTQKSQVLCGAQCRAVVDFDASQLLDVFIQRVEEPAANVGVRLTEVDVDHVGGDIACDLHQRDDVHRLAGYGQPGGGDGVDVRVALAKGLEDRLGGLAIDVGGSGIGHAPGAQGDRLVAGGGERRRAQPGHDGAGKRRAATSSQSVGEQSASSPDVHADDLGPLIAVPIPVLSGTAPAPRGAGRSGRWRPGVSCA